ncbi:MAG: superoxide dismutase family protein [Candidatus Binatia bacterium]
MEENAFLIALFFLGIFGREPAMAQDPVKISNTERQEVGRASLTDTPSGVVIGLSLREKPSGISPGSHAFHIHAVGKCEPPFKSAGDHYNPQKKQHGFLSKGGGHAGDLVNIHVPENGGLMVEFFVPEVRLKDRNNRLMDEDGSALVIHAQTDDYRSDPSGNAGDRIACGVIEAPAKTAKSK